MVAKKVKDRGWKASFYGYEEEIGEILGVLETFSILTVVTNTRANCIELHTRTFLTIIITLLFLTSACEPTIISINISILKT